MIEAVENLIGERADALKNGNPGKAAAIEMELSRFNVHLQDTPHGTAYKIG